MPEVRSCSVSPEGFLDCPNCGFSFTGTGYEPDGHGGFLRNEDGSFVSVVSLDAAATAHWSAEEPWAGPCTAETPWVDSDGNSLDPNVCTNRTIAIGDGDSPVGDGNTATVISEDGTVEVAT